MRFKKSLQQDQSVPDPVKARKLREHYRKLREQMRRMEEELQALGVDPDTIEDEDDGAGKGQTIEGEVVEA